MVFLGPFLLVCLDLNPNLPFLTTHSETNPQPFSGAENGKAPFLPDSPRDKWQEKMNFRDDDHASQESAM
jgi:hypothetical protein